MGLSYANLALKKMNGAVYLVFTTCTNADKGHAEEETVIMKLDTETIYLRCGSQPVGDVCSAIVRMEMILPKPDPHSKPSPAAGSGPKWASFVQENRKPTIRAMPDFDWFRIEEVR